MDLELFVSLSKLYSKNNYDLYLVGGAVRDYLLNKEISDFDIVTSALPEQSKIIFSDADMSFAKYGSITVNYENVKLDITTLRKEYYGKSVRKPEKIEFISSIEDDSNRRDFTINALYMDGNKKIYDFHQGREDLNNKFIRVIGDIDTRMKEDPLRMVRALRFKHQLNFNLDQELETYIMNNLSLLKGVSFNALEKELNKLQKYDEEIFNKIKNLMFNP